MQYLTALDKPKKLYAMLYGSEMPRNVEAFVAIYCKAYECNPDDAAITRHVLDAHLVHRLEGIPGRFSKQVNKAYEEIKADIIKTANDNAKLQYDQYIADFNKSAVDIVEKVAKAANRRAPERYKLMITLAYTVLTVTVLTAMLAIRYDFNERHIVGAILLVGILSFFGGMHAKE
ncbi:MAG: hypothetical protein JJE30_11250 [Desulfuromonadales bacterium]|nr:hypothetical protein [Desulfuromonadales bacterium]